MILCRGMGVPQVTVTVNKPCSLYMLMVLGKFPRKFECDSLITHLHQTGRLPEVMGCGRRSTGIVEGSSCFETEYLDFRHLGSGS
jgi:hypothetical protein